jgi:putative redox protein
VLRYRDITRSREAEESSRLIAGREAMVTTTVLWKEGMHFCTRVQSGRLMCDESSEIGAAYPSSPELLMASLGSCLASVLLLYGRRHGYELDGLSVDLDWKTAEHPYRIGEISVRVRVPEAVPPEQQTIFARVAHTCLIHNTLLHPPKLEMELSFNSQFR